jgi:acyl-[acyl-carrier-protein] desaturase
MKEPESQDLLTVLEPDVGRLFERHLASTKEWMPHELVPWERGATTDPRGTFDESRLPLDPGVRAALIVNLLTEDNLPYYFESLHTMFAAEAWREWARRWTAEEMRHSIVIRDYITVSHAVDLVALERSRMQQVTRGETPQPGDLYDGMVYVALQELATRVAHRNTGTKLNDDAGYQVMARVAADENLHYLFYKDLVAAALEIAPSATMCAIDRQVRAFEMPGTGIPDFATLASVIADAGLYDFESHHDQVLVPVVLRQWKIEGLTDLTPEAEAARDSALHQIERIGRIGKRLAARRGESRTPVSAAQS